MRKKKLLTLVVLVALVAAQNVTVLAAKIFDKSAKKQLAAYLDEICQYIMTLEVGSGSSQFVKEEAGKFSTHGNLARALMSGYELTKDNRRYLNEALRWCDSFVAQQRKVRTSAGNEASYWSVGDSDSSLDISDNGWAAVALVRGVSYASGGRKKTYIQALENYARLLLEGLSENAAVSSAQRKRTWIIENGDHQGAFAARPANSPQPSLTATAASSAFFSGLYSVTGDRKYREVAAKAVRWILRARQASGQISTDPLDEHATEGPLSTTTAGTEAILAAYYLLGDSGLAQEISKEAEPTARWFLRVRNERGTWGDGPEQARSTFVASFLSWFYLNVTEDEGITQALELFWQVLLNPVHSQSFGVQMQPLTTSLVGLTTAEMIKPGITFGKV